jgi:DEAD/DEAH box helicase domain-containing protein
LIQAAIDLLECCSSCSDDRGYDGGCPACIQAGECIKFNDFLSKSSALIIGKNLLKRMEQTEVYKLNKNENDAVGNNEEKKHVATYIASPRTIKRQRILRAARDMEPARQRQMVIGRPSWPMDRSDGPPQHQQEG